MPLHPVVPRSVDAEVGSHRDAHRAALLAVDPLARRDPRAHAVGRDHDGCPVGDDAASLATPLVRLPGRDPYRPARALVVHEPLDRDALAHVGSARAGVLRQNVIELGARQREAVAGEGCAFDPRKLESMPAADDAQTLVAYPAIGLGGGNPHEAELADRPRGQPIAADLVAWEARLLERDDAEALFGEVMGDGGPRRAGAHDDRVGVRLHPLSLRSPRSRPRADCGPWGPPPKRGLRLGA